MMIWKLLFLVGVLLGGLWFVGYRPADLQKAASKVSRTNAAGISPTGSDGSDWGH
jgi:hypothetical protein